VFDIGLHVETTHPVDASLDHPLSGWRRKEGLGKKKNKLFPRPSMRPQSERGADGRSLVGVSRRRYTEPPQRGFGKH